jgi:hypothetical protein
MGRPAQKPEHDIPARLHPEKAVKRVAGEACSVASVKKKITNFMNQ